jgi:hypothetical protein
MGGVWMGGWVCVYVYARVCQIQEAMLERGGAAARLRQTSNSYLSHATHPSHQTPAIPAPHHPSQNAHAPPPHPHQHPLNPKPYTHHPLPPPPANHTHTHLQMHDASSHAFRAPAPPPPAAIPRGGWAGGGYPGHAGTAAVTAVTAVSGPGPHQHPPPTPSSERGDYVRHKQGGAERRGSGAPFGGTGGLPSHAHSRTPAALVAQLPAHLGTMCFDGDDAA